MLKTLLFKKEVSSLGNKMKKCAKTNMCSIDMTVICIVVFITTVGLIH